LEAKIDYLNCHHLFRSSSLNTFVWENLFVHFELKLRNKRVIFCDKEKALKGSAKREIS
jgi:hypothetical protein